MANKLPFWVFHLTMQYASEIIFCEESSHCLFYLINQLLVIPTLAQLVERRTVVGNMPNSHP